jgi:hypothetical protein
MENEKIPEKNLPFYVQKYTIKIVDHEKLENEYGSSLYTTVGAIPSNELGSRVWQLNATGFLKPGLKKYFIIYDFTNAKTIDKLQFGGVVSGVFTICGNVLDSSKILKINRKFSNSESLLILELDTSKWDFKLKKESLFSYSITMNSTLSETAEYACAFSVKDPDGSLEKEGYTKGEIGNLLIPQCSDLIDSNGEYLNETYAMLCKDAKYTGYTREVEECEQFFNQKDSVRLVKDAAEGGLCAPPLTEVPSGITSYTKDDFTDCDSIQK